MPTTPADIVDTTLVEIERQNDTVREMAERPAAQQLWRPEPEGWSMAEHVDHLNLTNDVYLGAIEACLASARERGARGQGPFKRSWLAHHFVSKLGPPVTLKVKTMKKLVPPAELDPGEVARRFFERQERFAAAVEGARGVDLGRARFRSPLFALLKMDLGVGFDLIVAHNERHLWLCDRLKEREGFPQG